jgi:hypothetical protein
MIWIVCLAIWRMPTSSNAPCREKIWFEGGVGCGEDYGKVCIVVCSLYGLKSAGAAFRSFLVQILQDLGYKSTKGDPDVWLCKATKDNGFEYYEMLFVYVDDILALSHRAKNVIEEITEFYKAKEGSVVKPPLPNGREVWAASPLAYVKNSLLIVERLLSEDGGRGICLKD